MKRAATASGARGPHHGRADTWQSGRSARGADARTARDRRLSRGRGAGMAGGRGPRTQSDVSPSPPPIRDHDPTCMIARAPECRCVHGRALRAGLARQSARRSRLAGAGPLQRERLRHTEPEHRGRGHCGPRATRGVTCSRPRGPPSPPQSRASRSRPSSGRGSSRLSQVLPRSSTTDGSTAWSCAWRPTVPHESAGR